MRITCVGGAACCVLGTVSRRASFCLRIGRTAAVESSIALIWSTGIDPSRPSANRTSIRRSSAATTAHPNDSPEQRWSVVGPRLASPASATCRATARSRASLAAAPARSSHPAASRTRSTSSATPESPRTRSLTVEPIGPRRRVRIASAFSGPVSTGLPQSPSVTASIRSPTRSRPSRAAGPLTCRSATAHPPPLPSRVGTTPRPPIASRPR